MEVDVREVKAHLSRLLRFVAEGEEVTITRAGVPVAKLLRVERKNGKRPMGIDEGTIEMAADFDAPLLFDLLR